MHQGIAFNFFAMMLHVFVLVSEFVFVLHNFLISSFLAGRQPVWPDRQVLLTEAKQGVSINIFIPKSSQIKSSSQTGGEKGMFSSPDKHINPNRVGGEDFEVLSAAKNIKPNEG